MLTFQLLPTDLVRSNGNAIAFSPILTLTPSQTQHLKSHAAKLVSKTQTAPPLRTARQ